MSKHTLPLVLTSGEPAGIGPDLIVQLAQSRWETPLVVLGDPTLLKERAHQLKLPLTLHTVSSHQTPLTPLEPGALYLHPIPLAAPVTPGVLNPLNAHHVLQQLKTAATGCLNGHFRAVVTAPLHKGIINDAGYSFTGHTEYFQQLSQVDEVVMMLATPGLRVALVTTHLPLREVAQAITPAKLTRILTILHQSLQTQFKIPHPRISVAGLNPHAGENGHLGDEEIRIIVPVLDQLRTTGMHLNGPLPADTLFTTKHLAQADAVLAMYHDQGLPVLKYKGFGQAVNITLGLPFVRTSVDHGTALPLAGTGEADPASFKYAIQTAIDMTL